MAKVHIKIGKTIKKYRSEQFWIFWLTPSGITKSFYALPHRSLTTTKVSNDGKSEIIADVSAGYQFKCIYILSSFGKPTIRKELIFQTGENAGKYRTEVGDFFLEWEGVVIKNNGFKILQIQGEYPKIKLII